jgi:16S rRNA (adenine(1408)-N(1))-methyltransferase
VTIDLGTGDGRAVLAAAAREPQNLILGIDASPAAMAESSRRAAANPRKGGLPNARFLLAAAETLPPELCGTAHLVTVLFPWASLLRGVAGRDAAVARGVSSLVAAAGTLELLLAPSARDGLDGIPTETAGLVTAVRSTFEPLGFELVEGRPATADEIRASGSTWAKRLGAARTDGRSNGKPSGSNGHATSKPNGSNGSNGHVNGEADRSVTLVRLRRPAR